MVNPKNTLLALAGTLLCTAPAWAAAPYQGPALKGEVVTVTCPWTGAEEASFRKVAAVFEQATGATVQVNCAQSAEQKMAQDIRDGTPPHIAVFPQPGLASQLAAQGRLLPLGAEFRNWVRSNYAAGKSWVDLGSYPDGRGRKDFFGFAYNINVKSLVWYLPSQFTAKGYKPPRTMEQLQELTRKMAADGGTPWCIGLGSDDATGWPATDWVEDMMLRLHPEGVYDDWVSNQLKFNDPKVIEALETYGWFSRNDKYVAGGAKAVASTSFKDSPAGLFTQPPRCYMHRQASFIPAFFPQGRAGEADFFYLPPFLSRPLGFPVLGGGTILTLAKESKGARAFMDYLRHPQAHETWMADGGFLTPHKGVNPRIYPNRVMRKQGDILLGATTFRFDGSDLMPGPVGAGSFWKGMVDYAQGRSAKQVADDIQRSWEALK